MMFEIFKKFLKYFKKILDLIKIENITFLFMHVLSILLVLCNMFKYNVQ